MRWNSPEQIARYEIRARKRFDAKHIKGDSNTCWLWLDAPNKQGYPRLHYKGRPWLAHQLSYIFNIGEIPEGLVVRHLCHTPMCVNPNHLAIGTQMDNARDMVEAGRSAKGERHSQAILRECDIPVIRNQIQMGLSDTEIGKLYNAHRRTISDIRRGITWRHL